jgi:peroxiredoxin
VAVSYDAPDTLKTFRSERGIRFPLLSDRGSHTIDAYGVRNPEAKGRTEGIPLPGFFVIDSSGAIRAKLFERDYRERPSVDALIQVVREIAVPPAVERE